uniref:sensor histidine kinase n=1 Tax=Streptomyces sulphureus TaxID=47758 RepID=UPI000377299A
MATAHRAPSDAGPGRTAGYGDGPRNPFSAFLLAPLENRTYREFLYLLTGFPLAIVTFSWTVTMVSVSAGLLITFVGIPLLALTLASCRGIGAFERARARGLLHLDAPDPEPVSAVQRSSGLMAWVGALLRSGTSWRHLLYTVVYFPWATAAFTVSFVFWATGWALLLSPAYHWVFDAYTDQPGPEFGDWGYLDSAPELAVASLAGLVLVLLTPWLIRGLAQVDRLLVLGLLGPSRLAERAQELESDRGAVVDTAAADLRRIERDLHDGAQARLV